MDYGVGNLGSLAGALKRLNYRVRVASKPSEFHDMDAVILPGVGAMPTAVRNIRQQGLDHVICHLLEKGKVPIIGICLGMQLMFEHSEEGDVVALGLIPGRVRRLAKGNCHVGWTICPVPTAPSELTEVAVYFNHSYFVDPSPNCLVSQVEVEGHGHIAAVVKSRNFVGVQFHPEKSQAAGSSLLRHLIDGPAGIENA